MPYKNPSGIRVHPKAPVIACDLDGTLGAYHEHFVRFLREIYFPYSFNNNKSVPDRPWWKNEYNGEFSDALGLDKRTYRDAKLAFRQGGMKRCMPQLGKTDTKDIIQSIRDGGVQVWIATTRPWMRLDNVDPDTQFWLDHNVGRVDGVIYGEDKYADLVDIVGHDRILARECSSCTRHWTAGCDDVGSTQSLVEGVI